MNKYIFAGTLTMLLFIGSNLWADPPVCPPFEGFYIETITDVTVFGDLSESEDFEWTWDNDACQKATNGIANGQDPLNKLSANESVARITYSEEFDSYNGYGSSTADSKNYSRGDPIPEEPTEPTTLTKIFVADSHVLNSDNNVTVEKDIGYQSDGGAGSQADLTEKASVEVVSAGGTLDSGTALFKGVLALCPWATTSTTLWPATNMGVAMGSRFHVPSQLTNGDPGYITFASDTEANATEMVAMHYDVTADGKGIMETEMIVRLWEGSMEGTTNAVPLNSVAKYEEYLKADGIFQFHKSMNYRPEFKAPSATPVDLTVLE
ncbi:MAG: hypothetical protein U9R17_01505 [Thermodesulfobacteriota bacterium]|nr:hypothetical protein [Thermodesulfobacteriota bacterium]